MAKSLPPRVIVRRRMRQRPTGGAPPSPSPLPRRPGQKMGLTTERLLEAARQVLAATPGHLTIKAVAAVLGVAHNAVGSRLKREGTTLELALARDFLFRISRRLRPREDWKAYLEGLFADALAECESHPGLARVVALWLAQDPTLCPEFTDGVLYALEMAGLPPSAAADKFDVVLASLCGMLVVRFPDFGSDPAAWAKRVSHNLAAIDPRRHASLSPGAEQLSAAASAKAKPTVQSKAFANAAANLVVCSVELYAKQISSRRKG